MVIYKHCTCIFIHVLLTIVAFELNVTCYVRSNQTIVSSKIKIQCKSFAPTDPKQKKWKLTKGNNSKHKRCRVICALHFRSLKEACIQSNLKCSWQNYTVWKLTKGNNYKIWSAEYQFLCTHFSMRCIQLHSFHTVEIRS